MSRILSSTKLRRYLSQISLIAIAVLFSIGLQTFAGFTEPLQSPPNGNAFAPLNTGPGGQQKMGGLIINTGNAATGLIVANGNVGIGTSNPTTKLDVAGSVTANSIALSNTSAQVTKPGDPCSGLQGTFKFNGTNFLGCTGDKVWVGLTATPTNTPPPVPKSNVIRLTVTQAFSYVVATQTAVKNAMIANPGKSLTIDVTIPSGFALMSLNASNPALRNGNLPLGSKVTIINNGSINGFGGQGGVGGAVKGAGNWYLFTPLNGGNGGNGGNAINLDNTITTIINTNGKILAGGGGGGGGGSFVCYYANYSCGTGGGGGAGSVGNGGLQGASLNTGGCSTGSAGGNSLITTGGYGGNGGKPVSTSPGNYAGAGGRGGNPGNSGSNGLPAVTSSIAGNQYCPFNYKSSPGNGGNPGFAIITNGNTLTWNGKGVVGGVVK